MTQIVRRDAHTKQSISKINTKAMLQVRRIAFVFISVFPSIRSIKSTLLRKVVTALAITTLCVPGSVLFIGLNNKAIAAESSYINFQARILQASGALVPDGTYHVQFKLYDAVTSGTLLWTETRDTTTTAVAERVIVKNGYVSARLGAVTSFTSINWNEQLYLTINIGGTGASPAWDGEMSPRFALTSVPYAKVAKDLKSSATASTSTNSDGISISTGNATGLTSNSGNITIDTGTATSTAGTISIAGTNASSLTLARSGLQTTIAGNALIQGGTLTVGTTSQAGSLVISDGSSNTVTLTSSGVTANYSLILPTASGTTDQCLKTSSSSASQLVFGSCGTTGAVISIGTLDSQTKSANGAVIASSTLYMQTADSTNVGLVSIGTQSFAGAKTFTGAVTVNGAASVTSGNLSIGADSVTNGTITLYSSGAVADPTISANASGDLTIQSLAGTTVVGDGSGGIQMQLSSAADVLTGTKTFTAASAYSSDDFSFTRTVTGGANNLTGNVFKIVDNSTTSSGTFTPTLLYLNQTNTSAAGYLINAAQNGTSKFSVTPGGNTSIAGTLGVTGNTTLTGTLTANNTVLFKPSSNSITAFQVQPSASTTPVLNVDTTNSRVGIGTSSTVTGARLTIIGSDDANMSAGGANINIGGSAKTRVGSFYSAAYIAYNSYYTNIGGDGYAYDTNAAAAAISLTSDSIRFVTGTGGTAGTLVSSPEKMRLTNSGNLGIGDTTPASLLTVGSGDLFQVNSSGAIAASTGYTQTSGNFAMSGTGTFGTGTGAVFLNGATSVTGSNTLTVGTGATNLGGTLAVTGATTLTGALIVNNTAYVRNLTTGTATATDDQLIFSVTVGGAARFNGTITSADLTADRTYTLPNVTGTICTTGSVCSGYQASGSYLTAEADTLATVTGRGATTSTAISLTAAGTGLAVTNNATIGGTLGVTGAITSGLINSQTISSSANFTGTLAVTSTITGSSTITAGTTLIGTTGINTGGSGGTERITSTGNLVNIGTITSGLINSQTISSAANFTGTLAVATSVSAPIYYDSNNTAYYLDPSAGLLVSGGSNATYGGLTVQGEKNGWAGIAVRNSSGTLMGTLMAGADYSGWYNNTDNGWDWLWTNGILSAGSVPASFISGQTGMWTSAERPGPYRLYRRDENSNYSVQTYWTGARWRLYGYNGDSAHADTHVGYADSAGSVPASGVTAGQLLVSSFANSATTVYGSGQVCRGGSIYGYYFYGFCSSLAKYKDEVQNLPYGLETIRQLRPVQYKWNIDNQEYDTGFIAEEVNAVAPIFNEYADGKLSGVKYNHMISLAINGVKILDTQVQDIEGRLAVIESGNLLELHVTGDAEIGGSLTVTGDTFVQNITINGKIITAGNAPAITLGLDAKGLNATASVTGNDIAGSISFDPGASNLPDYTIAGGEQIIITFDKPYTATPRVTMTPTNENAAAIRYYIEKDLTSLKVKFLDMPLANTAYAFDYQIIQ